MEYGINLWTWAEPPSSGGDPVCHAGELISWESAWALGTSDAGSESDTGASADGANGASNTAAAKSSPPAPSARPPIYFGLPPILRQRRWES